MSDSEILLGYRVEFLSDGRAWRVVISDPTGADILIEREHHKHCLLAGVYSDRTTAKLRAFAYIRAKLGHAHSHH
jgi:hypothetical protein